MLVDSKLQSAGCGRGFLGGFGRQGLFVAYKFCLYVCGWIVYFRNRAFLSDMLFLNGCLKAFVVQFLRRFAG